MEYQKITNLLGNITDKVPRFITKKWIEVHDQSCTAEDRYKPSKQIRFKTSMLRSGLCDDSDAYMLLKEKLLLKIQIMMHMTKNKLLKIMHHSLVVFQKLIMHLLIMQKI